MVLTQEYQYIGRSSPVGCPSGYGYYLLIYAKMEADTAEGCHRVWVRTRLACDADSSFYALTTSGDASVAGVTAYAWQRQQIPYAYWGDSSSLTEDGITYPRWTELAEGYGELPGGFGTGREVTVEATWQMHSISSSGAGWFPNAGEVARGSIQVGLPGIPGASAIAAAAPAVLGQPCDITWTPLSPSITYRLGFALGDWSAETGLIVPDSPGALRYTGYRYPLAAAEALTDAASGELRVTLTTCSGDTVAGVSETVIPVTVPETGDTRPALAMALTPEGPGSRYFQGLSRVRGALTAQGRLGAQIVSCEMVLLGKHYSAPWLSDYLTQPGSLTVQARATDSRGFTAVTETELAVIPYSLPRLTVEVCCRADEAGNPLDSGTGLLLGIQRSCSSAAAEGERQNFSEVSLRLKPAGGAFGDWLLLLGEDQGDLFSGPVPGVVLDTRSSYLLQLRAEDTLGGASLQELHIPTEAVYMHRTANALGLGKYAQGERLLDCGWDAWFRGQIRIGEEGQTLEAYIREIAGG